jgi:hypothetical protein
MKSTIVLAAVAAVLSAGSAAAQTMSCADYLKADKQMQAQLGGASTSTGDPKMDAEAAALDKKVRDYCTNNPKAGLEKAMEEAMK